MPNGRYRAQNMRWYAAKCRPRCDAARGCQSRRRATQPPFSTRRYRRPSSSSCWGAQPRRRPRILPYAQRHASGTGELDGGTLRRARALAWWYSCPQTPTWCASQMSRAAARKSKQTVKVSAYNTIARMAENIRQPSVRGRRACRQQPPRKSADRPQRRVADAAQQMPAGEFCLRRCCRAAVFWRGRRRHQIRCRPDPSAATPVWMSAVAAVDAAAAS